MASYSEMEMEVRRKKEEEQGAGMPYFVQTILLSPPSSAKSMLLLAPSRPTTPLRLSHYRPPDHNFHSSSPTEQGRVGRKIGWGNGERF